MKIDNLKQLQQLIKLMRQTGVEAIEVDNIKMNLGPMPYKASKRTTSITQEGLSISPGGITEDTKIDTSDLTDEQLLFYSARPESFSDTPQQ